MSSIPFSATHPSTQRAIRGIVKRVFTKQRDLKWVYGTLSSRSLDSDDTLYLLTQGSHWLDVNHFQIELEKDVDWLGGPRVNLPACMDLPDWCVPIPVSRSGAELFCGSGHLSKAFEDEGYDMIRYDRKLKSGLAKDINTDWDLVTGPELSTLFGVSVVHMSPDCSTYSQLAASYHGRKIANDFLGTSSQARVANGHAVKLFNALRARIALEGSPLIYTAENPEATFHHHPMVKTMCRPFAEGGCDGVVVKMSFCAFGERVRKKTVFVTNSPTLVELAGKEQFYCKSAKCSFHKNMKHDTVTVRNKVGRGKRLISCGQHTDEVTAFPALLCQFVAKCIDVDISNLRNEHEHCSFTQCVFNKGHKGLCSHMMICAPCVSD